MRIALAGLALAVALPARTRAAPPAAATWADWIGDWAGKLRWSGCTVYGEPAATLALDAVDGAVAIDLSPAGGALTAVPLAPTDRDDAAWSGRGGDVRVRVAHGPATLEIAVELESGCAMHGSLRRETVGIAACDELAAWARIEDRCTKLVRPPLENFARVVRQRAEWRATPIEARGKLAAQCKARASKVEVELVAAGCAPDPEPPGPARFPACAALQLAAAKLTRCQSLPFDVATSLAHEANELAAAATTVDSETSRAILEQQCRAMHDRAAQAAQRVGCSL